MILHKIDRDQGCYVIRVGISFTTIDFEDLSTMAGRASAVPGTREHFDECAAALNRVNTPYGVRS